ncbi:MAG TPA: zf-HC2 domain-containing protein, partial [Gemmata sp.]
MADVPSPECGAPCPGADRLAAFLHEELSAAQLRAIESHVSLCAACGEVLHRLDAASDEPMREMFAGLVAGTLDDSDFERMMRAAERAFAPRASAKEEPPPPERVGQYQLFERLGRGGMGVVFRAQHLRLKKWVAVKLLPPGRVGAQAVARF